MNKFTLKPIHLSEFNKYYELLENDFCYAERKDYDSEILSFQNKSFYPSFIFLKDELVGYICFWKFDSFVFIEHFAILEGKRNQRIGSEFLKHFLLNTPHLIILEVERPTDLISEKRVHFYKRLGFTVNLYDYIQPSYHKENDKVPMYICSFDRSISHSEYIRIIKQIKNVVYV